MLLFIHWHNVFTWGEILYAHSVFSSVSLYNSVTFCMTCTVEYF